MNFGIAILSLSGISILLARVTGEYTHECPARHLIRIRSNGEDLVVPTGPLLRLNAFIVPYPIAVKVPQGSRCAQPFMPSNFVARWRQHYPGLSARMDAHALPHLAQGQQDAMEQRFRARGAAGDIDVDGNDCIYSAERCVVCAHETAQL